VLLAYTVPQLEQLLSDHQAMGGAVYRTPVLAEHDARSPQRLLSMSDLPAGGVSDGAEVPPPDETKKARKVRLWHITHVCSLGRRWSGITVASSRVPVLVPLETSTWWRKSSN
jgi:hypothetical protein